MSSLRSPAWKSFLAGTGMQTANTVVGRGATAVVFILVFYYASLLFWQVFYPEGFRFFVPTIDAKATAKFASARGSWDWFADTQVVKKQVPPSRLDASLVGVISVSREDGEGMAFIKYKGKDDIYRVGDEIGSSVVLHEIAGTYVVLQRDGRLETLEIKKSESLLVKGWGKENEGGEAKNGGETKVVSPELAKLPDEIDNPQQLRKFLRENPAQLLNLFKFERVEVNGRTGFSLSAKRDEGQKMLEGIGWREGDVVMSINGAPAFQVASNSRLWKALAKSNKFKFKVLRDGSEVNLSI